MWTKDWPKKEGCFWYFGWCFGDRSYPQEYHFVKVSKCSSGFVYVTDGHFLYKEEGAVVACCLFIAFVLPINRNTHFPPVLETPGPAEPHPRIEDHVAAVAERDCVERDMCLTRDSLERIYGIHIICAEERYTGRQVNPSSAVAYVPCSAVIEIRKDGMMVWKKDAKKVWVER